MKKMIKLLLIAIISLTSVFFVLGVKTEVDAVCKLGQYYDAKSQACKSVNDKAKVTNGDKNVGAINKAMKAFAYTIVVIATGLAFIMVVYSGFQYTASEGDPYKVEMAKNTLLKAGIGMLIAFSSYNILGLFDAFSTL